MELVAEEKSAEPAQTELVVEEKSAEPAQMESAEEW
jgi:hypothetical protein